MPSLPCNRDAGLQAAVSAPQQSPCAARVIDVRGGDDGAFPPGEADGTIRPATRREIQANRARVIRAAKAAKS